MEYLIAYGGLCLNHRPLSKARITAKKAALTGSERRLVGRRVIHVTPRQGWSPRNAGPSQFVAQFFRDKHG